MNALMVPGRVDRLLRTAILANSAAAAHSLRDPTRIATAAGRDHMRSSVILSVAERISWGIRYRNGQGPVQPE